MPRWAIVILVRGKPKVNRRIIVTAKGANVLAVRSTLGFALEDVDMRPATECIIVHEEQP